MKHLLLLAPLLLAAPPQDAPPRGAMARAIITVQEGGTRDADGVWKGGTYKPVPYYTVPDDHGPRDNLIAFEGPGWESDKIAYRLYLDERNVPDIYGKRLPGPVLHRIGQGKDDYHEMADWGQDILQVNATLGAGGVGALREGKITQLGKSKISMRTSNVDGRALVEVLNEGFAGSTGKANLSLNYVIEAGSRVTHVGGYAMGRKPQMVAGIIRHPGTQVIHGGTGKWRYVASWGKQSLAKDELGLALFYRPDYSSAPLEQDGNLFTAFCNRPGGRIDYAFAAAWIQEPGAPRTLKQFQAWLEQEANAMSVRDSDRVGRTCNFRAGDRLASNYPDLRPPVQKREGE